MMSILNLRKIKAFILDDEPRSITALKWELQNFNEDLEIIGESTDPEMAIDQIKSTHPDVLFLDIEMPQMNGFEVMKKFDDIPFQVIFTTAYDQFAIKAFEISAIDYLLKPIGKGELERAINKLKQFRETNQFQEQLQVLFENFNRKNSGTKKIVIPTMDGLEFVNLNDIVRCESDGSYTKIFLNTGNDMYISKTLKQMHQIIDNDFFFRIHNSHIVNMEYIKKYRKGKDGSIELLDGTVIPVSRSRKDDFLGKI